MEWDPCQRTALKQRQSCLIRLQRWPHCLGVEHLLDCVGDVLLPTSMDAGFFDWCVVDVVRRGACDDNVPCWELHAQSNHFLHTGLQLRNTASAQLAQ